MNPSRTARSHPISSHLVLQAPVSRSGWSSVAKRRTPSSVQLQSTLQQSPEEPDPLQSLVETTSQRPIDFNGLVNNAILGTIALGILWQLTHIDAGVSRGWTPEEYAFRIPLDAWASYSEMLVRAPLFTKAATSATVYTVGDILAQRTEGKNMAELDRARTARCLIAGLIGHGPLSHFWYLTCDALFENVLHLTQWWSFLPKVALDQTTWGPIWNGTFIFMVGFMQGEKIGKLWDDVKRTAVPLITSGMKLWVPAHFITYGLIPMEDRLLWVDMVEILWVTILATTAANAAQSEEPAKSA